MPRYINLRLTYLLTLAVLTFPAAYHNRNVIFFTLVYIALLWLIIFSSSSYTLGTECCVPTSVELAGRHFSRSDLLPVSWFTVLGVDC